jgi:hypothetical protein
MAVVRQPLLFARLPLGTRRLLFGLLLFGICFCSRSRCCG